MGVFGWNSTLIVLAVLVCSSSVWGQPREQQPILARFEDAAELVTQGERGRKELEVGVLPPDQTDAVRQVLRQAAAALESVDKEITNELPLRRRAKTNAGGLSADELSRLSEQVSYQLARASKNRGLLFEAGSDDRLSLLLTTVRTLERVAPQVPDGEPLNHLIQLDLAECHRLLGHHDKAAEIALAEQS
jgi:hypothetical protein